MTDDLVVCANDLDDLNLPAEEEDDRIKTSTATSAPSLTLSRLAASMSSTGDDPEAIIILKNI